MNGHERDFTILVGIGRTARVERPTSHNDLDITAMLSHDRAQAALSLLSRVQTGREGGGKGGRVSGLQTTLEEEVKAATPSLVIGFLSHSTTRPRCYRSRVSPHAPGPFTATIVLSPSPSISLALIHTSTCMLCRCRASDQDHPDMLRRTRHSLDDQTLSLWFRLG